MKGATTDEVDDADDAGIVKDHEQIWWQHVHDCLDVQGQRALKTLKLN